MEPYIVILKDNLTIQKAVEIKAQMLNTLEMHEAIIIQFDSINKIDLSFFQLFCAMHKTIIKQHKTLSISGIVPEIINRASENLGFKKYLSCPFTNTSCPWK